MARKRARRASSPRLWFRRGKRLVRVVFPLEIITEHPDESPSEHPTEIQCNIGRETMIPELSILDLPDECILNIFLAMDAEAHELCRLSLVCKRFNDICLSPRLWNFSEFDYRTLTIRSNQNLTNQWKGRVIFGLYNNPYALTRKQLVNFLSRRKARVSYFKLEFYYDYEAPLMRKLVMNCCHAHLRCLTLRLPIMVDWGKTIILEALQHFKMNCPNLVSLKFVIDARGNEDVSNVFKAIGGLTSLQTLEIIYSPNCRDFCTSLLDFLPTLTNLMTLKLKIRQGIYMGPIPDFTGYDMISSSLQYLEITHSKGTPFNSFSLPNLHTLIMEDVFWCKLAVDGIYHCIFGKIKNGCPKLCKLNEYRSCASGFVNFGLTLQEEKDLRICECAIHSLWLY